MNPTSLTTTKTVPLCRHIKANGDPCGSPRLRAGVFCFFHQRLLTKHQNATSVQKSAEIKKPAYDRNGNFSGMETSYVDQIFEVGLLEDRASVQLAISAILNGLSCRQIEVRRANTMLYGLQLALSNMPNAKEETFHFASSVTEADFSYAETFAVQPDGNTDAHTDAHTDAEIEPGD